MDEHDISYEMDLLLEKLFTVHDDGLLVTSLMGGKDDASRLLRLRELRLIEVSRFSSSSSAFTARPLAYRITALGKERVAELHRRREEIARNAAQNIAKEEKQDAAARGTEKRRERHAWLRAVVLLIIGWIIGYLTPGEVWSSIWNLFH